MAGNTTVLLAAAGATTIIKRRRRRREALKCRIWTREWLTIAVDPETDRVDRWATESSPVESMS